MEAHKKLSMNNIAASIIRNSLWFLVIFGIMVAAIFPFIEVKAGVGWQTATMYSLSIALVATLIRINSYARYFLEYQRLRRYIVQQLLFTKYKRVVFLEDVQVWIDSENVKLKERFLRDACFHLGVPALTDGTPNLEKFFPQQPKKPHKRAGSEILEQYAKDLERYQDELAKFKPTWYQKRLVKKIQEKDYPKIPWKASAILNVIGDADFYVNHNVFNAEKTYKRFNAITYAIGTVVMLFFVGSITAGIADTNWGMLVQALMALFSIFSSLIFGGIQGSTGGRKEERSLITANGIFKQIKPQEITEEEVEQYIRENQIVIVDDSDKQEKMNLDEIAQKVADKLNVEE